jgi:hypothetical protein
MHCEPVLVTEKGIGVFADAKNTGLQDAPRPEVYFPHTVSGTGPRRIMVKTGGNSNLILASLRREIARVDPDVALSEVGPIFLKVPMPVENEQLVFTRYSEPRYAELGIGPFMPHSRLCRMIAPCCLAEVAASANCLTLMSTHAA